MKNSLSGNIQNEMEVLNRNAIDRQKALDRLKEIKLMEKTLIVKETVDIMNGKITIFEKKNKK